MDRAVKWCLVATSLLFGDSITAAEPSAPQAVPAAPRPSFRITPLVQRFSGRRGQRIRFEFDIQTLDTPQSLRIRAVRLHQQLNGLVSADEASPPPEAVQLEGPLELDLRPQETAKIRGHVDVPNEPAPFHAFGILVTDLGRPLQAPANPNQPSAGIRFVTQFLLRLELNVENGRQESAKSLQLETAGLVERDGFPFVEADIINPTDTAVEFRLNARLLQTDGRQLISPFGLALPVRASRKEPERYDSVVFARSRVRLTAPLPEAIFPGEYELELEWISDRRKCGRVVVPVVVHQGDFPALGAVSARIADSLSITPPQAELSVRSGGSRRLALRLTNQGTQTVHVRLAAVNADGTPADWAVASPQQFELPRGTDRNVLLMARTGRDIETHRYGFLQVIVGSGENSDEVQHLPIALLGRGPIERALATGTVRWDAAGDRPAFVVPVTNEGPVHVPLNARLTIRDALGRRVEVPAGFDRWLMPGDADELRFPFHRSLPPGAYNVQVRIQMGPDREPLLIDQRVHVQVLPSGELPEHRP